MSAEVRDFITRALDAGPLTTPELVSRGRLHQFSEGATRSSLANLLDEGLVHRGPHQLLYRRQEPLHPPQFQADQFGEIRNNWSKIMERQYQRDAVVQVSRHVERLGPNACGVLVTVAERLAAGAQQYGVDFDDGRNWTQEALAEQLDAIVYIALALKAMKASP